MLLWGSGPQPRLNEWGKSGDTVLDYEGDVRGRGTRSRPRRILVRTVVVEPGSEGGRGHVWLGRSPDFENEKHTVWAGPSLLS